MVVVLVVVLVVVHLKEKQKKKKVSKNKQVQNFRDFLPTLLVLFSPMLSSNGGPSQNVCLFHTVDGVVWWLIGSGKREKIER